MSSDSLHSTDFPRPRSGLRRSLAVSLSAGKREKKNTDVKKKQTGKKEFGKHKRKNKTTTTEEEEKEEEYNMGGRGAGEGEENDNQ